MREQDSLMVNPLYPRTTDRVVDHEIFVLMPFAPEMRTIYEDCIKPACAAVSARVARADDFFTTKELMADVWHGILNARAVIADCSGRNPNVFYELGISHALGRQTILTTQDSNDIPADIGHLRYLAYEGTPDGLRTLQLKLVATLTEVLTTPGDRVTAIHDSLRPE